MSKNEKPKLEPRVSRRELVKLASAGAVATATLGATEAVAAGLQSLRFDEEVDVLVVGSGAAAMVSAVAARNAGATVLIIEKAAIPGGTTARSGGGAWLPNNSDLQKAGKPDDRTATLNYMARASFPHLYTPGHETLGLPKQHFELFAAYFDNAAPAIAALEKLDALHLDGEKRDLPDLYVEPEPVPNFKANPARTMFPRVVEGSVPAPGAEFIRQLKTWTDAHGVKLLTSTRVTSILQNDKGEVVGLQATKKDGKVLSFRAKKGVIFGSGGFTNNREMVLQFQPFGTYGGCAVPTNSGDLVTMAGAIGAQLGNMNGAFRVEVVVDQALEYSSIVTDVWQPCGDSMMYVNKYGVRSVNEKRNYNDRSRAHFTYDPTKGEYPNQIQVMVWDQRTAELHAGNFPVPPAEANAPHVVSGKTIEELTANLNAHVESLKNKVGPLANIGVWRLDKDFAANLKKTIERFNGFAKTGVDEDFGRGRNAYDRQWHALQFSQHAPSTKWKDATPNITMAPFQPQGPYYATLIGAGTLDTNGGPVIDGNARIVDTNDKPIPGLYGAGNCVASPSATTYLAGGNTIGSALTFGWIAGNDAAKQPVKAANKVRNGRV